MSFLKAFLKVLSFATLPWTNISSNDPSPDSLKALNTSLNGRLISIHPPAYPCHQSTYDAAACAVVKQSWDNSAWRSAQIGAMQNANFEQGHGQWCSIGYLNSTHPIKATCAQGNVPTHGIDASEVNHIRLGVAFASDNRMPITVKGTGHDFLGRSTDPKSLLIWTRNMKNITIEDRSVCGTTFPQSLTV